MSDTATSAAAVMKLIGDQLTEERSTKSSLEARAIGVITSSGALVTLLFALTALVTAPTGYALPETSRYVLVLTLVGFALAAILAIIASRPQTYEEVLVSSLRDAATPEAMSSPAGEGEAAIAAVLINILEAARVKNGSKAQLLKWAVGAEAVAAVLLAVAAGSVLIIG